MQRLRYLRTKLQSLQKKVLLKLLIAPRRGRNQTIHRNQKKKRTVIMKLMTVTKRQMDRWRGRRRQVERPVVEVEVRLLISHPVMEKAQGVAAVALLQQIKVHNLSKEKPLKEDGPVSHS